MWDSPAEGISSNHMSQLGGLHCTLVSCACDDPLPDTHTVVLIWLSTLLIFTKSNFSVGTLTDCNIPSSI